MTYLNQFQNQLGQGGFSSLVPRAPTTNMVYGLQQPQPFATYNQASPNTSAFAPIGQVPVNIPEAGGVNLADMPIMQTKFNNPGVDPSPDTGGFGLNTETLGTIGSVLGGLGQVAGAIGGFQQIGIAKDQLNFQKDVFAKNWANQVALTNSQLRGRQRARTGASSYYQDADSYMKENQVK